MDTYLILKLVHIISATVLFGTGLGTAFYMWRAHLKNKIQVMAYVSKDVVLADWLFTAPAVIAQIITGLWMWSIMDSATMPLWIWLSLVLYVFIGLCWLPVVWLQIQIAKLCQAAVTTNTDLPARYQRYMKTWFLLGWPAFISVLAILYLMVFKPV